MWQNQQQNKRKRKRRRRRVHKRANRQQRGLSVLALRVYLRDYFSTYCAQEQRYLGYNHASRAVCVEKLIRYWIKVETGRPDVDFFSYPPNEISTKLPWPKTNLFIKLQNVFQAPDGIQLKGLPCSLSKFRGRTRRV